MKAAPNSTVENFYGPTETTVFVSRYIYTETESAKKFHNDIVPIGNPFTNHKMVLIDEENKVVGEKDVGEIAISGSQVSKGYLNDPEKFIIQAFGKLKKNGILSISLPTDPGILWRTGRAYLKLSKSYKILKIDADEYEYMNSTEHINSIFNLIAIINYHFKDFIVSKNYWPFKIQMPDLNLFYNVNIKKIS